MIHSTRRASAGFSFIEIIVAIFIMGILAAVGFGAMSYLEKSKRTKVESVLQSLQLAITSFNIDTGTFPATLNDLVERPADAKVSKMWKGPYAQQRELRDSWSHEFQYQLKPKGSRPEYELYSWGKKGETGAAEDQISVHNL